MNANDIVNPETDSRFPSGPWTGFFQQSWLPGRHTTDADLSFEGGRLWGSGRDWVGPYTVEGHYDTADGRCRWTKHYLGKHSVTYSGCNEGKGIWGVWEIRAFFGLYIDRGLFHLWPRGQDPGDEAERTYQAASGMARPSITLVGWVVLALIMALGGVSLTLMALRDVIHE
jgi:hypothetical protein